MGWDCMNKGMHATYSFLCVGIPHYQHSAAHMFTQVHMELIFLRIQTMANEWFLEAPKSEIRTTELG